MKLPLRAWKKTWSSLGFVVRERKPPRRRRPASTAFRSEQLEPRVMLDGDDLEFGQAQDVGPALPPPETTELVSPVWPPEIAGSDHMVWPEPYQDAAGQWVFPVSYFDPTIILPSDLPTEGDGTDCNDGPPLEQGGLGDDGQIGPAAPDGGDDGDDGEQIVGGGNQPSQQPQVYSPNGPDIVLNSFTRSATSGLVFAYTINGGSVAEFKITIYASSNAATAPTGTPVLKEFTISDANDRTAVQHTLTFDNLEGLNEVQTDYYLVAKVDADDVIDESNESNNEAGFAGGVFKAGNIVYMHGVTTAANETVTLSQSTNLTVTFGTSFNFTPSGVDGVHIRMHDGNDTVNSSSSVAKDTWVFGGAGNDTIAAGGGNDQLYGGAGDDTYNFGSGVLHADTITEDSASENNALNFGSLGGFIDIDLTRDGGGVMSNGYLTLNIVCTVPDHSTEAIRTVTGTAFNDVITGNLRANNLYGGNGDDMIFGRAGDDVLDGGNGYDHVYGEEGSESFGLAYPADDYFSGGPGNDYFTVGYGYSGSGTRTMDGGAGNDVYTVYGFGWGTNVIIEPDSDTDIDTVNFASLMTGVTINLNSTATQSFNTGSTNFTLQLMSARGIENVVGTNYADTITANAQSNVMQGGMGSDTYIFPNIPGTSQGNDEIIDYTYSNYYDTLNFTNYAAGVSVNLSTTQVQTVNNTTAPLSLKLTNAGSIRYLYGSGYDDVLTGNNYDGYTSGSGDNYLYGNGGNDYLYGLGGNDYLDGGTGVFSDHLFGGDGNDTLDSSGAADSGDDELSGDAGNDTLYGGVGNDTFSGGTGDDKYYFSTGVSGTKSISELAAVGTDMLDFSTLSSSVSVDLSYPFLQTVSGSIGLILTTPTETTDGIENVLSGSGNDTITGNSRSNVLQGGAGNDTYRFSGSGPLGTDTINESSGGGTDTLNFSAISAAVTANLLLTSQQPVIAGSVLNLTLGSSAAYIENIVGGSGVNTLTGNDLSNTLTGGSANDILTGGKGNDTLIGGGGADHYAFALNQPLGSDVITETNDAQVNQLDFSSYSDTPYVNYGASGLQSVNNNLNLTLGAAALWNAPQVSIANVNVTEGNSGSVNAVFAVTLLSAGALPIRIPFATTNGTAIAGSDYTSVGNTLTFAPGVTSQNVTVAVTGDSASEADETFNFALSGVLNAIATTSPVTGRILNDDNAVAIASSYGVEGDGLGEKLRVTATLTPASAFPVTVQYATSGGTAAAGTDYSAASGYITFQPGETTRTFTIPVIGDTAIESDESIGVQLSTTTNAIVGSGGTAWIVNDDNRISVGNVSHREGDQNTVDLVFPVTLSTASSNPITVQYATGGGDATAGTDYASLAGTLTFAPNVVSQNVTVTVNGDLAGEANESFNLMLSGATNATIAAAVGVGTILNDDLYPLALQYNTGDEHDDVTGIPTIQGSVLSDTPLDRIRIELSYTVTRGTSHVDYSAEVQVEDDGHFFFTPGLLESSDQVAIKARAFELTPVGTGESVQFEPLNVTPPWTDELNFTFDADDDLAPVLVLNLAPGSAIDADSDNRPDLLDPTVTGTVQNDGNVAGLTVKFYQGTDEIGWTTTDDAGHFSYTPRDLPVAQNVVLTAKAFEPVYDPRQAEQESNVDSVDFDLVANQPPQIVSPGLQLVSDTGTANDQTTANPRLHGTITNADGPVAGVRIVFDHTAGDGVENEDGYAIADAAGHFEYEPLGLTANTTYTFAARAVEEDFIHGTSLASSPATFTWTFDPAANSAPTISSFHPRDITAAANPPFLARSANAIVVGTLANDTGLANVLIEFSRSAQFTSIDGYTLTDDEGHFSYTPLVDAGQSLTLYARAVESDALQQTELVGQSVNTSFQVDQANDASASFDEICLAYPLGVDQGHPVVADPTIVGHVDYAGDYDDIRVELNFTGGDHVDQWTAVDANGDYQITPIGLNAGLANLLVRIHVLGGRIASPAFDTTLDPTWYDDPQTSFGGAPIESGQVVPTWDADFEDEWFNQSFVRNWDNGPFRNIVSSWTAIPFYLDSSAGDALSIGSIEPLPGRSSFDPTVEGHVTGDGNRAGLTVELYYDGGLAAKGTTITDDSGDFRFTAADLGAGAHTISARVRQPNFVTGQYALSDPLQTSITVAVDPSLALPTLNLANWLSAGNHTAIDPTIQGSVQVDDDAEWYVEIDSNADGLADAVVEPDIDGSFTFVPHGLSGNTAQVKARLVRAAGDTGFPIYGGWSESLSWTIVPNAAPTIDTLRVALDSGDYSTDRVTIDPTLTGTVSDDVSAEDLLVEFYIGGVLNGQTRTAGSGAFTYTPTDLALGATEIEVRVHKADPVQDVDLVSESAAIVVTLAANTAPNVTSLSLVRDDGDYSDDGVTTDARLTGTVVDAESLQTVTVSFYGDANADGNAELLGTAKPDSNGEFTFLVPGLKFDQATNITATAGEPSYLAGSVITGQTQQKQVTLIASITPSWTVGLAILGQNINAVVDPTLSVVATPDAQQYPDAQPMWIDFDYNNDGLRDGWVTLAGNGSSTFRPDLTLATHTIRSRLVVSNFVGDTLVTSQSVWREDFALTYAPNAPGLTWTLANNLSAEGELPQAFDPVFTGAVTSYRDADVVLQFDHDEHHEQIDDSFAANDDGTFTYQPTGLADDVVTVYVRTVQFAEEISDNVYGQWQEITFRNQVYTGPAVSGLQLLHVDSQSPLATTDPTFTGVVSVPVDDSDLGGWIVQIDQNGDGLPEGTATADATGHFTFAPSGLAVGSVHLRVRGVDPYTQGVTVLGAWNSLDFTLNALPTPVATIALATGADQSAHPVLQGSVSHSSTSASTFVQFDFNQDGQPDALTTIDAQGNYSFASQNLPIGEVHLRARAVTQAAGVSVTGQWSSVVEFDYQPVAQAVVAELYVTDFARGTIAGRITVDGVGVEGKIDFDHNHDNLPDGTVFSDTSGYFTYQPRQLSAGTVTVQAIPQYLVGTTYARGTARQIEFTYSPPTLVTPTGLSFGLLSNTGAANDSITGDPTLVGSIAPTTADVTIEWDISTGTLNGTPDGSSAVSGDGTFTFVPENLTAGTWHVAARYKVWNPATPGYVTGNWTSPQSFTLAAGVNNAAAVTSLHVREQTGTSQSGLPTTGDPVVTGVIDNDGSKAGIVVEFARAGSDDIIGQATTRADGSFSYAIAGVVVGADTTIRARTSESNYLSPDPILSGWTTLQFVLVSAPVVSSLALANGQSAGSRSTSAAVVGQVASASGYTNLSVQLQVSANHDTPPDPLATGSVNVSVNSQTGAFSYTPQNLQPGPVTLWARAAKTNPATSVVTYGPWQSLSFELVANVTTAPSFNEFALQYDTGTAGDGETSIPTLTGKVDLPYATIEIEVIGQNTTTATLTADAGGNFVYTLQGLPLGQFVTIRAKASAVNATTGVNYDSGWHSLNTVNSQIKLVAGTIPTIPNGLQLLNDTGTQGHSVTDKPVITGTVSAAGRIAGLVVEFDHNGDDKTDGTAITGADGFFSYEPTGLLAGQSVTIRARIGYWNYATGSHVDGNWNYSIAFELTEDIAGKPQLDDEIVTATAPNAQADKSLSHAITATLHAILGSNSNMVNVGVGSFTPLASGNSQIASGESLADHEQSPFVLTGGLPGNHTDSRTDDVDENSGVHTLHSDYSWSYETSVNTTAQTITITTSLTMTFNSTDPISAGLSQGSDSESHTGTLTQYGAYSFTYTATINYVQTGSSVTYTGGTQSLTERSDYRYEHTDTVTASTSSAAGTGTSSTTTNTDGRYYYLYTENGGFDGSAPTAATLTGQSNSFANWTDGSGLSAPSFSAFGSLPSPGSLPAAASGSIRSFAFASGYSTHASTTGSGNSLQTTAGSQTQNNFSYANAVSFDQQLVGAGVYSEDEDGYWTSGVTATSVQASRTSSSDNWSTIHAADSTGSSDGTTSSKAANNFGLTLAVITTYAITSPTGPAATRYSTSSDTFSYQDHFNSTGSSQGVGSYATNSTVAATTYQSSGEYQVDSSSSVSSSYLAIGGSTQSRTSIAGGSDAVHSLLSMNYVTQNSAQGSFGSFDTGASHQTASGSTSNGNYQTASATTYNSSMSDIGSSMGPDDNVISQGQVILNLGGTTNVAYAANGNGEFTVGASQTQSSSSVGQTSTSEQSSSQNYHYISSPGHYSADGNQSSNSNSSTNLASQTTGTVSDISGSSPKTIQQFKNNDKSTGESTSTSDGSFSINDGAQEASGGYSSHDSSQRRSTSFTRDVSNTEEGNSATSLSRSMATETSDVTDGHYSTGAGGTTVSGDTMRTANRSGDTQTDIAFKHVSATGSGDNSTNHEESGTRQTVSAYAYDSTDDGHFLISPSSRHSDGSFEKHESSFTVSKLKSKLTDSSKSTTTNSSTEQSTTVTLSEQTGTASKSSEDSDYVITGDIRTSSGDTTNSDTRFAVADAQTVSSNKSDTPNSTLGVRLGNAVRSSSTSHSEDREDNSYDGTFDQTAAGTTSTGDVTRETSKKSNTSGMSLTMNTSQPLSGSLGTNSAQIVGALFSGSAESTYSHEGTQKGHADGRTTLELTFSSTDKSNTSNNSASFAGSITTGPNNFYGTSVTVGLSSITSSHDAEETEGVYNTYDNGSLRSADYESTDKTNNSASSKTLSGEAQASLGATWTTHFAYSTDNQTNTQDSSVNDKGKYTTTNGDRVADGTTTESNNTSNEQSGSSYQSDTKYEGSLLPALQGSSENTAVTSKSASKTTSKQNLDDGKYKDHAGTYTERSGKVKKDNNSNAKSETVTAVTNESRDGGGGYKHENSKSVATRTETKSKKETSSAALTETTLTSQQILEEIFAKTTSNEWGDFAQPPGYNNPLKSDYQGSGTVTYKSTLKSDTDDGVKGKQSLETHGTDVGERTTHFTNETIHSDFGNVTYRHSTSSEDHDSKSDYDAKHDFTLDDQGQQTAEHGTLKSDFVTTANNNHHANDDRVEGYALPGDGYHSTKTHNEYDRDVYSHQEIHDQGVYSGTLQGDGDYSRRQGVIKEVQHSTDNSHVKWQDITTTTVAGVVTESSDETHLGDWLSGTIFPLGGDHDLETEVDKSSVYNGNVLTVEREDANRDETWTYAVDSVGHRTGSDWYDGNAHTTWERSIHVTQHTSGDEVIRSSSEERTPFKTVGWAASVHDPDGDPIYALHQPASITITDADGRTSVTIIPLPGANSPGVHNTIDQSDDDAWWGGFYKGLKAGWYTVVDTYTPDFLLDVSKETAAAWKDSGLEGTWTQTATELTVGASRELALMAASGGGSLVCGTSRLVASGVALARTAAVAAEVYDGYQNVMAAQQNFQEGNYWTGAFHAGLAVLNAIGVKGGVRALKSDVHLAAFPGDHCFRTGTLVATESGRKPIEQIKDNDRVWSFDLVTLRWRLCKVLETYAFDHCGEIVAIFIAGTRLESTYHHPYWVVQGNDLATRPRPDHVHAITLTDATQSGRWVDAGDLRIGDHVLLMDGSCRQIDEIVVNVAQCRVYNFAVDNLHNYAVGPDGILVHNGCGVNLNNNKAVSQFGVYAIKINGILWKIGKADFARVTKLTGLPTRLHQQVQKLEKIFGPGNVVPEIVAKLGETTTGAAKVVENAHILDSFRKTGFIPIGNWKSFTL